jgi:hypothetical protein
MQGRKERRQSKRVEKQEPLHYRVVGPLSQKAVTSFIFGTSVNACVDHRGFGIVTDRPLYRRETIVVRSEENIRTAEVRWVGTAPAGYRAGVQFV